MGGATSKDRYDRAATTGILTLNTQKVKSWSSVTKALTKLSTLRIITITHNPLRDPVPYAFTALSLWRTLVSLDLSHNGLTCACALGSEAPLSKTHAKEARTRIAAAPVSNAAPSTTRLPLDRSLEVVALQRNQLKTFVIADNAVDKPFPALRELLLDQNHLGGTVSLGFAADEEAPTMASLRRISLDEQKGTEPLRRVNAAIFAHCPGLTSLSLQGNCNEEEIHDSLVQSDIYRKWQERQKEVVDKKLHAGGQAELI
ncbi:Leucine Rich Repeat family protein [Leishmania donovani]|uniref:Leucine Rich Repeat family protein n=1 Tax=Leishmania donovani TaxID=5661 RepID=A0A504XRJ4_LEIDO|nr:Leucine Rich Repeat family protein [Leishmania donovani]